MTEKSLKCEENEMKEDLPHEFLEKMLKIKKSLILDLKINTFEKQCFEVNEIILDHFKSLSNEEET